VSLQPAVPPAVPLVPTWQLLLRQPSFPLTLGIVEHTRRGVRHAKSRHKPVFVRRRCQMMAQIQTRLPAQHKTKFQADASLEGREGYAIELNVKCPAGYVDRVARCRVIEDWRVDE
jgi:hypothetical protein